MHSLIYRLQFYKLKNQKSCLLDITVLNQNIYILYNIGHQEMVTFLLLNKL